MKRPGLNELSLTEKIAQLLMVADEKLQYKMVDGENQIRPKEEIDEILQRCQFGSYWHTGTVKMDIVNLAEEWATGRRMSMKDSKNYIDGIQKNVRLPMLVAMDAEYGVGYSLADGSIIPSPLSIGAADEEETIKKLYAGVAKELRAAGANWRWCPVVDLVGRLSASICRIFSDDPERVTRVCTAAIRGAEQENVATTVKHFPGGSGISSTGDSHFTTTCLLSTYADWKEKQGKIFQNMIDAGVMTVMVGHEAFPAVDDTIINGNPIPCTISPKVVQGLLREEMGFKGVIITDAISMAGLTRTCSTREEVLIRAINAGNDILLGVTPEDFDLVYAAVCDGRIPMQRIDESCERVLTLKEKIGLFNDTPQEEIDTAAVSREVAEASRIIAEKSVTLLYDKHDLLPISKDTIKSVSIVYASHYSGTGEQLKVMKEEFEKRGATVTLTNGFPTGGIAAAAQSDLIIYVGYLAMHRPAGLPSLYGDQLTFFNRAFTQGREKSIGVSMGYPYLHIDVMGGADTFVNIYSPDAEAQRAFVRGIYGEIPFVGTSPVDVEPKIRQIYC